MSSSHERLCAHGCVFCFAWRYHTFSDDDGIESRRSKIYVKANAPLVLRQELRTRSVAVIKPSLTNTFVNIQ